MFTVFVTGPTGVLGRAAIPKLIAAGYRVHALSRSVANDCAIRELGAEPVRADLFAPATLATALSGADAVLHLATRIPPSAKLRRREAWADNDRIRAEGTRHLVSAALDAGVRTFVYPSFAFVYPDSGDDWIDAATTPAAPTENLGSTIAAEQEVLRFAAAERGAPGRRGIALRMGALYGPDLPSMTEQLQLARRGVSMFGAAPRAFTPTLWVDDAAAALVAALDRAATGIYDVVDDDPLRQQDLAAALANAVGRRRVFSPPPWAVRLAAGSAGEALLRSLRISNRRFREAAGWAPSVPNARIGLAMLANAHVPSSPYVPAPVRVGLLAMAVVSLGAGFWQQVFPRSFYDDFPGFGRQRVSVDGPFNEHLMRDVGGPALAFGLLTLFALVRPSTGLVRAVALAYLVAQVPHFIYHAFHLDLLQSPLDVVLQTMSLLATIAIPLLVLIEAGAIGREGGADASAKPLTTELISPNKALPGSEGGCATAAAR